MVAHELGVPLSSVRCSATDTAKVANTSATAASAGRPQRQGRAGNRPGHQARLTSLASEKLGSARVGFVNGVVHGNGRKHALQRTRAPGLSAPHPALERRLLHNAGPQLGQGQAAGPPFYYYAWGGAVVEAVVDTLTGETRILQADLLHDVGTSLNPAIDIPADRGQLRPGPGVADRRKLVWDTQGRLRTHAPSTYIPHRQRLPPVLKVELFGAANSADLIRSKGGGRTPVCQSLLAIKDACAAPIGCDRR